MEIKFHEFVKRKEKKRNNDHIHITVWNKIKLLEPSGSYTENKEFPTYISHAIKIIFFQRNNRLFEVRMKILYEHG